MRRCKKSLRNLIVEDCLKRGDFTTSSGEKSDYYVDLRQISMSSTGAYLIGKTIYNHTKNMEFDAIGGPAVGAIPLVTATVLRYWRRERRIKEGFWIGSGQEIDGRITRRHKVIVIEDVCTTGESAALTVQALKDLVGCKVVGVIALVDREEGAKERFQDMGIMFDSIFEVKDLIDRAMGGRRINPPVDGIQEKSQSSDSTVLHEQHNHSETDA